MTVPYTIKNFCVVLPNAVEIGPCCRAEIAFRGTASPRNMGLNGAAAKRHPRARFARRGSVKLPPHIEWVVTPGNGYLLMKPKLSPRDPRSVLHLMAIRFFLDSTLRFNIDMNV